MCSSGKVFSTFLNLDGPAAPLQRVGVKIKINEADFAGGEVEDVVICTDVCRKNRVSFVYSNHPTAHTFVEERLLCQMLKIDLNCETITCLPNLFHYSF